MGINRDTGIDEPSNEDRDKARAEAILKEVVLPPEIERIDIRTGSDSTGDPAMWVVLWVKKELQFDQDKANLLNQTAEDVQVRMLAGGFSRFPYVTLDQAA